MVDPQQALGSQFGSHQDPAAEMKYLDKDEQGRPFQIPEMYKMPYIKIDEHDKAESLKHGNLPPTGV